MILLVHQSMAGNLNPSVILYQEFIDRKEWCMSLFRKNWQGQIVNICIDIAKNVVTEIQPEPDSQKNPCHV